MNPYQFGLGVTVGILAAFTARVITTGLENSEKKPAPAVQLSSDADSTNNPISWQISRDPATAILSIDLSPWGLFGMRVRSISEDGSILEDQQSNTVANNFQLVMSDPAHAVGWHQTIMPKWINELEVTLYSLEEMAKPANERKGTVHHVYNTR